MKRSNDEKHLLYVLVYRGFALFVKGKALHQDTDTTGKFRKGNPRWVNLATRPTNVPKEFIVCAGFNPTGTKGVFVGIDGKEGPNSMTALPGREGKAVDKGNWMIRVRLDQLKSADSLTLVKK